MDNFPELRIDIGMEESDNYEYAEHGLVLFHIPHYQVRVNLKRGFAKNITPRFTYTIGTIRDGDKKAELGYYHLPLASDYANMD